MTQHKMFMIFFIVISIQINLFSDDIKNFAFEKEEQYIEYSYSFVPFEDDEKISYTYENKVITVYAKDSSGSQRLVGQWENINWGSLEFSQNRKQMLFGFYRKGYNYPVFLLNSEQGSVKYLFNIPQMMKTSSDFSFLLGFDYDYYRSTRDSKNNKDIAEFRFILFNILNNKFVDYIYWDINKRRLGGGVDLIRSNNKNYDFHLLYTVEGTLWADSYYSIKSDNLYMLMDDTSLENWRSHPYDKTQEERGFFPSENN